MPLISVPEPFDSDEFIYELKLDGFRALAHVNGHRCTLLSRNGHRFAQWDGLREELAHALRCRSAIVDGEIVCLDPDGRPNFHKLLFRRDWPYFFAFDLLELDGEDLRDLPILERKERLLAIMPVVESRIRIVDHVQAQGAALYDAICARDLEGVVAKWKRGTYQPDGVKTSWLKIRNPSYSQAIDRHELFEKRRPAADRSRRRRPELVLA